MNDQVISDLLDSLLKALKKYYKIGCFALFFAILGVVLMIFANIPQIISNPLFIVSAIIALGCLVYFGLTHITVLRNILFKIKEHQSLVDTIPVVPKDKNPTITSEQINAAIVDLRKNFPDDAKLAEVSDAEIVQRVSEFLKSDQVFTPLLSTPSAESMAEIAAVTDTCPYAIAVVIVDCIFMILGFVGLRAANSKKVGEKAAVEIAKEVGKDPNRWKQLILILRNSKSLKDKIMAIKEILSAALKIGMFSGILAEIKSSMRWWDWVITGVAAIAQLTAMLATGGAAFAAKVALSATDVAYVMRDTYKAVQICNI